MSLSGLKFQQYWGYSFKTVACTLNCVGILKYIKLKHLNTSKPLGPKTHGWSTGKLDEKGEWDTVSGWSRERL